MTAAPNKSLSEYQRDVDDWVRTIGVRYFSELTNTAILMEEVGEVARRMPIWPWKWPMCFSS
jgi:hypothetical protein